MGAGEYAFHPLLYDQRQDFRHIDDVDEISLRVI